MQSGVDVHQSWHSANVARPSSSPYLPQSEPVPSHVLAVLSREVEMQIIVAVVVVVVMVVVVVVVVTFEAKHS